MADPNPASGRWVVIGIGNADRGDDAVGLVVARRLRARKVEGIEIFEDSGECAGLLDRFENAGAVFLIDAALSGAPPGSVRRFDVGASALPSSIATLSTHGFDLAGTIELARALKRLPLQCVLYTVELADCRAGAALSAFVEQSIPEVITRLCAEISCLRR